MIYFAMLTFSQNVSGRTLVGLRYWNQVRVRLCPLDMSY